MIGRVASLRVVRRRASVLGTGMLLSAAFVVTGCSGTPEANQQAAANDVIANESYVSPNLAGGSWNGVFADPAKSIDNFARIGLRPGPYTRKGAEWRSDALPTALTDPSGPHPVMANFVASGDEKALAKIEFSLTEPQLSNDQQARDAFDRWISQALGQLGVTGGDTAVKAIHGEARAAGSLKGGANYAVTRTTDSKARRVVVTFTPTDAISDEKAPGAA